MARPKQYKRINIYLTEKQDQNLRAFSDMLGVTYAELVRRGISEYLQKLLKDAQEGRGIA